MKQPANWEVAQSKPISEQHRPSPNPVFGSSFDRSDAVLGCGMLAVFLFLLFRNTGLHPVVFADEWGYSLHSRLTSLAAAPKPSYIYLWLLRSTNSCGSGFLECARIINSIFFVAATPFIYLTARWVTTKPIAAFIALLSIAAPINSYTAYFMPEAMYFFAFWVLTWFAIKFRRFQPAYYAAGIGAGVAAMTMIKVNAVFLLPGMAAFLVYAIFRTRRQSWVRVSAIAITVLIASFFLVRLGWGYLFAGTAGFNILGTKYASLANSSLTPMVLLRLGEQALGSLRGHLMGLSLLFGVPMASMMTMGFAGKGESELDDSQNAITAYTALLLIPLLIGVAYFTASVVGSGPYESLTRLHMRYYDFLFPLFFIIVAGQLSGSPTRKPRYAHFITALLVVALSIYSLKYLLTLYTPGFVDAPELQGFTVHRLAFYCLALLGLISVIVWAFRQRVGAQLFVFVFMPLSVLTSSHFVHHELRAYRTPGVYDTAGMAVHSFLDKEDRSRVLVASSSLGDLARLLFYIDDPKADLLLLPEGVSLNESAVPADKEWVLLVGDYPVAGMKLVMTGDGYSLWRVQRKVAGSSGNSDEVIDFSREQWQGIVWRVSGLSPPAAFGRWSVGPEVKIEMVSPLPQRFTLRLKAFAFGPNAERPFILRIGSEAKTIRLSSAPGDVSLAYQTDGSERAITIQVPAPTSPQQLGLSTDDRPLGIGLMQMTISAADPAP
jgi:phosphoglycerol transferase